MRKYAIINQPVFFNAFGNKTLLKKVMIYFDGSCTLLFHYENTDECSGCSGDYWFENLEEAEDYALEEYNIKPTDWIEIDDPLPHCQHDVIRPFRIKGRDVGNPIWGELESFDGEKWVDFIYDKRGGY